MNSNGKPHVLIIDDDLDIVEVVSAVLGDEGYEVAALQTTTGDAIARAIGQSEPDCILLDSVEAAEYGEAWQTAARIHARGRPIPTVMFTAHVRDVAEAEEGTSDRSRHAAFAAVLSKPFHVDELLRAVEQAVGTSVPFNHSAAAEQERTRRLVDRLRHAGATDIAPSQRREWANFSNAVGDEMQLYWWQGAGQYLVARYNADGDRLEGVGRFFDLEDAVHAATT